MSRRQDSEALSALLANMTDPEERKQVASFLQGLLAGSLEQMRAERRAPLRIVEVQQRAGANGNYESHFTVVTESGIRIRVQVTPEEDL